MLNIYNSSYKHNNVEYYGEYDRNSMNFTQAYVNIKLLT